MYRYLCIFLLALPGLFQSFIADAVTVDLDQKMPNPLLFVLWDNGKSNCIRFDTTTGVLFRTPPAINGETLQKYVDRSWKYSPPTPGEKIRCAAMKAKYTVNWKVAPLIRNGRSYQRPVYALAPFIDAKVKIGTVKAGTPCGSLVRAYSKRIKALTWRQVVIPAGIGVTVCKK